ncbi:hypothetical protein BJV78DRAFT_11161 [Lactifluus subvellereus]|nr:hypothetical protein BJV78DRAFT_11161 [Lactifluus subvellereus]
MSLHAEQSFSLPRLGGKSAVVLFIVVLIAFVVESQLTQYVQSTLHFRQPFFLFYVVHSTFALIFPLHLLFLVFTTPVSLEPLLAGLSLAIKIHYAPGDQQHLTTLRSPFPHVRFLKLVALLTLGYNCPSLIWFISVSLSSLSDITAIWNTNAFFTYIITVRIFKLGWETRKLFSVLVATVGVMAVVYGDAKMPAGTTDHRHRRRPEAALTPTAVVRNASESTKPTAPLVGDLLSILASVWYGWYQVLYKRHVALPSDPEFASAPGSVYVPLPDSESFAVADGRSEHAAAAAAAADDDLAYPPPFGLHPNLLTSGIGLMTFFAFWILLPILHYSGYERFRLPDSPIAILSIAGIAISGLVFNAGAMVLLGIWGPIVVSVGNLLTIVLILLSDVTIGQGVDVITPWNLAGSCGIMAAFGILVYDMIRQRTS